MKEKTRREKLERKDHCNRRPKHKEERSPTQTGRRTQNLRHRREINSSGHERKDEIRNAKKDDYCKGRRDRKRERMYNGEQSKVSKQAGGQENRWVSRKIQETRQSENRRTNVRNLWK